MTSLCSKCVDIVGAFGIMTFMFFYSRKALRCEHEPVYMEQNYLDRNLDCNPKDVPVYTGHSLFNTTKRITLLFIVQSFLHCYPPNIWIEISQIAIQIECLQGTKFHDSAI